MKWRQTLLLLLVFLLAGGYYYTFEVVMKEKKETAEKEAKKLFNVSPYKVTELELERREGPSVKVRNENGWRITEPVKAEGDRGGVENLVRTLADMESEKVVLDLESVRDLKPYGLDPPAIRARFLAEGKWHELLVGEKSPMESGYFARTGDGSKLVLIEIGNFGAIDRKLEDLRRKDLALFKAEDATRVQVAWKSGERVVVERSGDAGAGWKAEGGEESRIKPSKVENVLSRLQWLKARQFLENETGNLTAHGLDPAFVTVEVTLRSGETIRIQLGEQGGQDKASAAVSSQLPGVTLVDGSVLADLPKTVAVLEDRALLNVKQDAVDALDWRLGEASGTVVRMDAMKWGVRKGEGPPKPLEESWRMKTLFWDLGDTEYVDRLKPAPAVPEAPSASLAFRGEGKELATLRWERLPEGGGTEPVTVWLSRDGDTLAVKVDPKALARIEQDLAHLEEAPAR